MPRTITRMGIPSRVNTNMTAVQSQEFIPGPTIPSAAISSPTALQPQAPGVPQSNFNNQQTEVKNVKTPQGNVEVEYSIVEGSGKAIIKPINIVKNITFNVPYTSSSNGFTNSGTTTYDYALQKNNLVQQVTAQKGSVVYDGVDVANINNGSIQPTTNKVSQQIVSNNQYLGTITYIPKVNNNTLSLSYSSFTGTTVQKTVPVYYTDPFSGATFKVGYTYSSNPTTYNPTTNQVSLTFPSLNEMFGMTSLYLNAQTTTTNINGKPQKVFYNLYGSPSGENAFFTGFNVGGKSQQNIYITNGGSTTEYQISAGNIVNAKSYEPISLAGINTKASLVYQNNQYSIQNPQSTEYLSGGIDVTGTLGISSVQSGQITYSFTPTGYALAGGSQTIPTTSIADINLAKNLLTSQGFSASQIANIFQQQPTSISESINSKTGAIQLNYTPYVAQQSFLIGSGYTTSGYVNYNSKGQPVGGADFLNAKQFKLISGPSQITSNGNILLNGASLPSAYGNSQFQLQLSNIVSNNLSKLPSIQINSNNPLSIVLSSPFNPGESAVLFGINVGEQAYSEGYQVGAKTISLQTGLTEFAGTLAEAEAPVFIVAAPITSLIGIGANLVTGEALSYYNTGAGLSKSNVIQQASLGAISGSILGVLAPEGASAVSFTITKTAQLITFNSALGAGINAAYGILQPSAFLGKSNLSPTNLGNTRSQSPKTQTSVLLSQGTTTPSQSPISNTNDFISYLNFVGAGALQGANFATSYGGEVMLGSSVLSKVISLVPGTAGAILKNPLVIKPLIAIGFGASSYEVGIAMGEPQKEALISGFFIGASTLISGGTPGKTTNTELNPENTAAFFKVTPTGNTVDILDTRTPTPLDLLNNLHAQSTYYLDYESEGIKPETGVISTSTYQVSFNNGKILYAVSPNVELTQEGLSGASYDIGSKLYGSDRAYFAATATERMPVTTTISASESTVQSVSITNLDLSNVKGKIFGIDVKNIINAKVISYVDVQAGTTDTQTQFGEGEGEQKIVLNVKNNFFQRLLGNPIKEITVSDKYINTPTAIVTSGGNENFIGRITTGTETENTGAFYGEKGSPDILSIKKTFGNFVGKADYTGKVLTPTPSGATQSLILYYETNNLADIASKVGFDAGEKPYEPTDISTKPLKPFPIQTTDIINTNTDTTSLTPSGEAQVTSSLEKGVIKGAPPVSLQAITTVQTEQSIVDVGTAQIFQPLQNTKPTSITGLDPIIQQGQKMSTNVIPTLGINSSLTTRQNISNSLIQKSIFPTTTTNPNLLSTKYGNPQSLISKNTQSTKQIQTQKQTAKTTYLELNRGAYPISSVPNTKFDDSLIPFPFKLKNTKAQKKKTQINKSIYFGYIPDLSHALLNITGSKTKIGLSRPLLEGKRRSKK